MANGIDNRLETFIGEIMLSYGADRGKIPEGAGCLPSREVIIDIAHRLRQLLFPGYFGEKGFLRETQRHHVGEQLHDIHEALTGQIVLAFRHQANQQDRFDEYDAQEKASRLSIELLSRIPKSANTSPPTWRRRLTATRPRGAGTRSYSPIRASSPCPFTASRTSCTCFRCRSSPASCPNTRTA